MKYLLAIPAVIMTISCASETSLVWIEGEKQPDKHAVHELVICNPPAGTDWDIWGVFDRTWTMPVTVTEDSDADITRYDGVCLRITPRVSKDTLHVRYDNIYLNNHSRAPRGFTLQMRSGGKPVALPLEYVFLPAPEPEPEYYTAQQLKVTDMIPQLKKVEFLGGETVIGEKSIQYMEGRPEWYRITIDGAVRIEASDSLGEYHAGLTLSRLLENAGGSTLPNMIIEDWPDFPTRAFMLDVARNFIPKEDVFRIIDVLARARINTLLIHLTEDEGWRLEISGLPELTSYGAFHAIPRYMPDGTFKMTDGLFPAQDGRVGKEKPWYGGNGYYSREEFKEILLYAKDRHMDVIPEIDVPGHSAAAIFAMQHRAETTGNDDLVLVDPDDKSEYMAYQGYEHNVLDVALPATYKFLGIVFDDLKAMYAEAGLNLTTVNISGDEVAEGCWIGSPSCRKVMEANGWTTTGELWSYFLSNVIDMLAERGLKFAGYAEVVMGTSEQTLKKMRDNAAFIIYWRPLGEDTDYIAYKFANDGFPMLLSHSDFTYMDNTYQKNPHEWGLQWAGATSEAKAFSYDPLHLDGIGVPLEKPENIIGIEPMLWGDNIYSFEKDCYLLFPKAYGMFDRCWNAECPREADAFDKFYSIVVERELVYLDSMGMNYRKPRKEKE